MLHPDGSHGCGPAPETPASAYDEILDLVRRTYVSRHGDGGADYFACYLEPVASMLHDDGEPDEVALVGVLRDILGQRLSSITALRARGIPERTIDLVETLTQPRGVPYLQHLRERVVVAGREACLIEHSRLEVNLEVLDRSEPLDVGVSLRKRTEYRQALRVLGDALSISREPSDPSGPPSTPAGGDPAERVTVGSARRR